MSLGFEPCQSQRERSERPSGSGSNPSQRIPLPLFTSSSVLASLRLAAGTTLCSRRRSRRSHGQQDRRSRSTRKNLGKNGRILTAFGFGEPRSLRSRGCCRRTACPSPSRGPEAAPGPVVSVPVRGASRRWSRRYCPVRTPGARFRSAGVRTPRTDGVGSTFSP